MAMLIPFMRAVLFKSKHHYNAQRIKKGNLWLKVLGFRVMHAVNRAGMRGENAVREEAIDLPARGWQVVVRR
ncbi:hypothetical protein HA38_03055 [Pantoea allii]|nr:hypothetical protein HA38_03055 [Pantoea allii]PBK00466.1 hypothetical protein CMR03_10620 [Pantoea allii]